MSEHHEHDHEAGGHERGHPGSGRALTLISLAHGINHGQSALKPLVYPLVLIQLGFGYAELGIMLGVASAVGGSLQLMAGGLGRFVKRHLLLGLGNAFVGICFVLITIAQSFPQFFLWTVMSRWSSAPWPCRSFWPVFVSCSANFRAFRKRSWPPPIREPWLKNFFAVLCYGIEICTTPGRIHA